MVSQSSSGCQKTWSGEASKFGTWTFGTSTKVPTASSTSFFTRNIGTREIQQTRTPSWSLLSAFQVPNSVNNLHIISKAHFISLASLLFWDNRQKRHHCFQENMMRGGRFDDEEDPIQVEIVTFAPINSLFRRWLPHRTRTTELPKTSSKSSSTRARSSESATENLIFITAFLCKIIYRIINVNAIQVVKVRDLGVGDFYLNLWDPAQHYFIFTTRENETG